MKQDSYSTSNEIGQQLTTMEGFLEFKFKKSALNSWSDVFMRMESKWLVIYKHKHDIKRLACIELGKHIIIDCLEQIEKGHMYPRRFEITCSGGRMEQLHWYFRVNSRQERDQWVKSIWQNSCLLTKYSLPWLIANYSQLEMIVQEMKNNLSSREKSIKGRKMKSCYAGKDIIQYFKSASYASSVSEAMAIGQDLIMANLLQHSLNSMEFSNSSELYILPSLRSHKEWLEWIDAKCFDSKRFWFYIEYQHNISSPMIHNHTTTSNIQSSESIQKPNNTRNSFRLSESSGLDPMGEHDAGIIIQLLPENQYADRQLTKSCYLCTRKFGNFRRKYNCGVCGGVVCSNCGHIRSTRLHGQKEIQNVRICLQCTIQMNELKKTSAFLPSSACSDGDSTAPLSCNSQESVVSQEDSSRKAIKTNIKTNDTNELIESVSIATQQVLRDCGQCSNQFCKPITSLSSCPYPMSISNNRAWPQLDFSKTNINEKIQWLQEKFSFLYVDAEQELDLKFFQQMIEMASIGSNCPYVRFGIMGRDHYYVKAQQGFSSLVQEKHIETPSFHSFVYEKAVICQEVSKDIRFQHYPLLQQHQIQFYGSFPILFTKNKDEMSVVGILEVMDSKVWENCGGIEDKLHPIIFSIYNHLDKRQKQIHLISKLTIETNFITPSDVKTKSPKTISVNGGTEGDEVSEVGTPVTTPPITPGFNIDEFGLPPSLEAKDLVDAFTDSDDELGTPLSDDGKIEVTFEDEDLNILTESIHRDLLSAEKMEELKKIQAQDLVEKRHIDYNTVIIETASESDEEEDVVIETIASTSNDLKDRNSSEYEIVEEYEEIEYEEVEYEDNEEEILQEEIQTQVIIQEDEKDLDLNEIEPINDDDHEIVNEPSSQMEKLFQEMVKRQEHTAQLIAHQHAPMRKTIDEHGVKLQMLSETLGRMEAALGTKPSTECS